MISVIEHSAHVRNRMGVAIDLVQDEDGLDAKFEDKVIKSHLLNNI